MASPQKENGYTAIANEIMEALARIRINGEARQMLDVIIRKTYGFNKKQDRISTSQFVEATRLPNYAIHKARYKLLKMGLIEVLPKKVIGVTQKGNSQILTYSFQKDYTKWQPLPKKVTVTQKGNRGNPKRYQTVTQKAIHKRHKDTITKEKIEKDKNHLSPAQSYFYLKYKDKTGKEYVADFAKDGKIFKDLSKVIINIQQFKEVINRFFNSEDEFIIKAGYTVGVFRTQINKLQTDIIPRSELRKEFGLK